MAELAMVITRPGDLQSFMRQVEALHGLDGPHQIELKPYKRRRSLDQNALYWLWMTELSKYLKARGRKFASQEWCHEAMKHSFLGYRRTERVDVKTGEVQTREELRSTTKLSTGDMTHYLQQVEAWAAGIGCLLPVPDDSDYMHNKRSQVA